MSSATARKELCAQGRAQPPAITSCSWSCYGPYVLARAACPRRALTARYRDLPTTWTPHYECEEARAGRRHRLRLRSDVPDRRAVRDRSRAADDAYGRAAEEDVGGHGAPDHFQIVVLE